MAQPQSPAPRDVAKGPYSVVERGAHHKVWERIEVELAPDGTQVEKRESYQELATGMHFKNERGEWEESKEEIEILPNDAGAIAAKGPHKVIFPVEIKAGIIEMQTPDGKWLRSRVWGLAYFDASSGESVLLAEVKESDGQLVGDNVVVYPDAFTDFRADVRYTYTRAGFEQDVVLRENPPAPQDFGLNPATTRLQVLTEFVEAATPQKITSQAGGLSDQTLGFGTMNIGMGKAFSVDAKGVSGEDIPVLKQWNILNERSFLIEEVLYENVDEQLRKLPAAPRYEGASLHRRGRGENVLAGLQDLLPTRYAKVPAPSPDKPRRMARVSYDPGSSFVMDYVSIGSSLTNYIFKGDTTYHISGATLLYGTNVMEGNTVIKYNASAYLRVMDKMRWETDAYRPAVLTAKDDNSVGAKTPETFTYDADGNLTSDSLWTNVWNGENRRVTIESQSTLPAAAKVKEVWTHLADGRWIERIVSTNNGTSYYPAFTNRYVWDNQVLLAVLDHTNGVVVSFMRGLDLSGSIQGAGGVGRVLAVKAGASAQCGTMVNTTHFTCYDGNGNVTALVNATDGSESARYEYAPFAEKLRETGPMAKLNPIRFSTQYADDVTGDTKYLFRDYQADVGRWLSRDPVVEAGWRSNHGFGGTHSRLSTHINGPPDGFHMNNLVNNVDLFGLVVTSDSCTPEQVHQFEQSQIKMCQKALYGKKDCCGTEPKLKENLKKICRKGYKIIISCVESGKDACKNNGSGEPCMATVSEWDTTGPTAGGVIIICSKMWGDKKPCDFDCAVIHELLHGAGIKKDPSPVMQFIERCLSCPESYGGKK